MGASNVTWHPAQVSRDERAGVLGGRHGATVWFTGLSGSGKSTVATALEKRLIEGGRPAYRLDGDNLRTGLSADLGFSRAGREENVRRAAEVAGLFADSGLVAIVALISPYRTGRLLARRIQETAGLPFVEVFMATSVDVCADRDPKGLYARASAGEIGSFTGVDDPYEPPEHPELTIESGTPLDEAVDAVIGALRRAES
ncbi:MAG: adenylyl-sulfate kinase [Acidimicrobiales bacterium]|nr:adenylyl-sulfate kinase [Acidimicrobiales bacterium]